MGVHKLIDVSFFFKLKSIRQKVKVHIRLSLIEQMQ